MKICYFGIYKPGFSRNGVYMSGLRRKGIDVVECRDDAGRFSKYVNLYRKHRQVGDYDIMIVGYPGHVIVPFARLISHRPIVADLLGSFKDAEEHSHAASFWRRFKDGIIDWLAVRFADVVLLESEAQKDFFIRKFGQAWKFRVVYTGLDESAFYCPASAEKSSKEWEGRGRKVVLFRGRLTPESGIFHILKAAELLKGREDITFRIIGFHYLLGELVKKTIKSMELNNVELFYEFLPDEILREKMCEASVALGQFESNPRLDRTIPHKIFEAMRMGIPVITGSSLAVGELLQDGKSCLFVKRADPRDLANKICALIDDPNLAGELAANARKTYDKKLSTETLVSGLINILEKLVPARLTV